MIIKEFCEAYKAKKFMNLRQGVDERAEWIKKELEIRTYIPFREKREIAEMIVAQNTKEIDGVKKNDSINQYVSFIVAMISAHTNLTFSDDPVADYDLLAESGLLSQIVAEFQESYSECEIVLKMALAMELEDNSINVLVGKFLNGILQKLDVFGEGLKDKLGNIDLKEILGSDFKPEDLAKLKGFLDRYNN